MINLKGRMRTGFETKRGFGNLVDIFNDIKFSQIIYCFMLTIFYNRYQNGKTDFQPTAYLSVFILTAIIIILEMYMVDMWKIALGEIAATALISIIIPIENEKIWFIMCCIILCVRSLYKQRFRFSQSAIYSERYRDINRNVIQIAVIIILFFIHVMSSDEITDSSMISPQVCNNYMLASLAVFIISTIMTKYAFKFYEYYRQELKEDVKTSNQLKHSFLLIFAATAVLTSIIFLSFGKIFVPVIEFIVKILMKIIFSLVLLIFNIDLQSDRKISSGQMAASGSQGAIQKKVVFNDSPIYSIIPMLLIILIVAAVLYVIWKIYKNILANYKVDTDEVEFISPKEPATEYESSITKSSKINFGKSNKEKIRKYYYNLIVKKKRKYDITFETSCTPHEIKNKIINNPNEREAMENMTEIYEKARYSDEDITDKEVEMAKKINEQ